eukprot:TRINITY_DN4271_c0_g1_i6.p1 TRINITY_DN4271_c0_g1~~TRINITY_DN4271_c0_g1_i6.p1  ORF type:complete len:242 (-),score=29.74 TRINITY_DN4271_c0_g1_i6:1518-2243(-)
MLRKNCSIKAVQKDPRSRFNNTSYNNGNNFNSAVESSSQYYQNTQGKYNNFEGQFQVESNRISAGQVLAGLGFIIIPILVLDYFGDEPISLILPLSLFLLPPVRKFAVSLFSAVLKASNYSNYQQNEQFPQQQKYQQQTQFWQQNYYNGQYQYKQNLDQRALPGDVPTISNDETNFYGIDGKQQQSQFVNAVEDENFVVQRSQDQNRVGIYIRKDKIDKMPFWAEIVCTVFPFMRSWAGFL